MKQLLKTAFFLLLGTTFFISCSNEGKPFKFAHISDVHLGQTTSDEDLMRTIKDINENSDIEFTVVTGDITEFGSDEEIVYAKSVFDKFKNPVYIIPGNHDANWSESGANTFKNIFGSDHFSFEKNGYLFVGTSSGPNMRMAPGLVPHDEIIWLQEILDPGKIGDKPVIFLNHYPMNEEMANWYEIIEILKKVNIQAILNGHGHINKAFDYEGIPGVMGRSNLRANKEYGGYNIVSVRNDSMFYAERTPGIETKEVWRTVELKNHNFKNETKEYKRPSYAVNETHSQVKRTWEVQENSDIAAGIVANKKMAFHPNSNGDVVARNIETGEEIWRYHTTGMIYSTPDVKDDYLVIASTDSVIYNLDANTGAENWKVFTGKSIVASPTIDEGVVYIGSSEGVFRALDLKTGDILWQFNDVKGFVETKPLVDEERVYFGSWGNQFYALNKKTGEKEWGWSNGSDNRMLSPAAVFPVKANGKVYISDPARATTAFNAKTGKVLQHASHHKGRESIGVSQDEKYVYVKAMTDTLFVYNTSKNSIEPEWKLDVQFGYEIGPTPTVEYDNLIFIASDKGDIYAVNRKEKMVEWVHKMSNALVNNVFPIDENSLLTTTMDGKVIRLEYPKSR